MRARRAGMEIYWYVHKVQPCSAWLRWRRSMPCPRHRVPGMCLSYLVVLCKPPVEPGSDSTSICVVTTILRSKRGFLCTAAAF